MKFALVFVAMFVMDFVWAEYTAAISGKKPTVAGVWAIGIILLSGYVTKSYVDDVRLLAPAGLGAFAGTWAAVYMAKREIAWLAVWRWIKR